MVRRNSLIQDWAYGKNSCHFRLEVGYWVGVGLWLNLPSN